MFTLFLEFHNKGQIHVVMYCTCTCMCNQELMSRPGVTEHTLNKEEFSNFAGLGRLDGSGSTQRSTTYNVHVHVHVNDYNVQHECTCF